MMTIFERITSISGHEVYNASNSEVVVADYPLEFFTNVTITTTETNRMESGVDVNYTVPIDMNEPCQISISVLPTSPDSEYLERLEEYVLTNGGYFQIVVVNNGKFAGTYSCVFSKSKDISISNEPEDEVFVFHAVREDKGGYNRMLYRDYLTANTEIPQIQESNVVEASKVRT